MWDLIKDIAVSTFMELAGGFLGLAITAAVAAVGLGIIVLILRGLGFMKGWHLPIHRGSASFQAHFPVSGMAGEFKPLVFPE
ncbi:MAG: hypothetical protein ACRD96_07365, partial [Bryobacteraceae bacterium]